MKRAGQEFCPFPGISAPRFAAIVAAIAALLGAPAALAQAKPSPAAQKAAAAASQGQKGSPARSLPRLARLPLSALAPAPPGRGLKSPAPTSAAPASVSLIVPAETPLRVSLSKTVPLGKVGEPIAAQVTEPVYAFDRVVIPQGSEVTGKIAEIIPASKLRRTEAIMNGNFTPLKTATIEFDTLALKDGTRLPIETKVSLGIPNVIRLVAASSKPVKPGLIQRAKRALGQQWHYALQQARTVVSYRFWKKFAIGELPYHHQYLREGTVFDAELLAPLRCGQETLAPGALADYGQPPPPNSVVEARLLTALNSATARKGGRVEAVVTQPLFSPRRKLLVLPEGTRLEGSVVQAHPARRLHRNGLLRIVIQRMTLPSGATARVDASLAGLAVGQASHIKLDSEGGASISTSKKRYLDTALSLAIAMSTTGGCDAEDRISGGSCDGGNLTHRSVAGGSGFKLVGLALGMAVHSQVLSQALGFYGAAWSVYNHFLSPGRNVILAKNTPMVIAFGAQQPSGN